MLESEKSGENESYNVKSHDAFIIPQLPITQNTHT